MAQMAQNMNPTMMREAQEQMSKLTPEQLRQGMVRAARLGTPQLHSMPHDMSAGL